MQNTPDPAEMMRRLKADVRRKDAQEEYLPLSYEARRIYVRFHGTEMGRMIMGKTLDGESVKCRWVQEWDSPKDGAFFDTSDRRVEIHAWRRCVR